MFRIHNLHECVMCKITDILGQDSIVTYLFSNVTLREPKVICIENMMQHQHICNQKTVVIFCTSSDNLHSRQQPLNEQKHELLCYRSLIDDWLTVWLQCAVLSLPFCCVGPCLTERTENLLTEDNSVLLPGDNITAHTHTHTHTSK